MAMFYHFITPMNTAQGTSIDVKVNLVGIPFL